MFAHVWIFYGYYLVLFALRPSVIIVITCLGADGGPELAGEEHYYEDEKFDDYDPSGSHPSDMDPY